MSRKPVLGVRLDYDLNRAVEELASLRGMTKSAVGEQLIREALGPDPLRRARIRRRAAELEAEGLNSVMALRAAKMEIETDPIRKRVDELEAGGMDRVVAFRLAMREQAASAT